MKKQDPHTYQKPSRFMKLYEGENRIRVLDGIWTYKKISAMMRGRFVSQIVDSGAELPDALSKVKQPPKQQWGFIVYDYRTDEPLILETGPSVGDPLAKLMASDDWRTKDIVIFRKKTGPQKFDVAYQVEYAKDNQIGRRVTDSELSFLSKYFDAASLPDNVDRKTGEVLAPEKGNGDDAGVELSNRFRSKLFATLRDKGIEGDAAREWVHEKANVESTKDLDIQALSRLIKLAQEIIT